MSVYGDSLRRPRLVGVACAVSAVALGLIYMTVAGAPLQYLAVNAGALFLGLAMLALVGRVMREAQAWPGAMTLLSAIALLLTSLFGEQVEGAMRWVRLGPLFIQSSLILLPVMIVGFARARNALATVGMIVAAVALAIQPDRAMAAMLAAGLTILAVMRADRFVIQALVGSLIGVAVTLLRPDTLPAMPYVDQILYSSFDVHALAGLSVLMGTVLLVVPAIVGLTDIDHREVYSVFGTIWLVAIVAAALGNYPTPIVGYGGSAVLGYALSLAMLPRADRSCSGAEIAVYDGARQDRPNNRHPFVGLSCAATGG